MTRWNIQYRGPLSSCNYSCDYCPFAKTKNTRAELDHDAACLERFVGWAAGRAERLGILFTPWGEALIRSHYQEAIVALSHMPQVERVVAQTNLSFAFDWLEDADRQALALWATWHPSQVGLDSFVARCDKLLSLGIRFSVGVVGLVDQMDGIETLRSRLPNDVYVWINAYKRVADYYGDADISRLTAVDPLFGLNNQRHPSAGTACAAGHTAFTVDGEGDVRRCHFVGDVLGNIHDGDIGEHLATRTCPNATCGCYIGYIHMDRLALEEVYGASILERIPEKALESSRERSFQTRSRLPS